MKLYYRAEGRKIDLEQTPTDSSENRSRQEVEEQFDEAKVELQLLQELLYGASDHSVLLILQGRDTSGKDGTIKRVLADVNPLGCEITAFKVPTEEERAHDFLWRIHKAVPAKGKVGIFNRSHYEDILVPTVHQLLPDREIRQRFQQINHFEQLLLDSGTILVKCLLHISAKEQEKRLLEREKEERNFWKLSVSDWSERQHWEKYTQIYEELVERCASSEAPWFIVPADRKWCRNLAVTEILIQAMKPFAESWRNTLQERGKQALQAIETYRRGPGQKSPG